MIRGWTWEPRLGAAWSADRLRKGSSFPSFLETPRMAEKALDDLIRAIGGMGVSKSQASRLCEETDERVKVFLNRPPEHLALARLY